MKYYSDMTNKLYDSIEALEAEELKIKQIEEVKRKAKEEAERKAAEAKNNRAAEAKEVEEAYKVFMTKLHDFCEKHGAFHMTLKGDDIGSIFRMF